jgi:hypothetical protein
VVGSVVEELVEVPDEVVSSVVGWMFVVPEPDVSSVVEVEVSDVVESLPLPVSVSPGL